MCLFACISSSLSLAFERSKLDVFLLSFLVSLDHSGMHADVFYCFLDVYSEYSAVWKNDSQMKSQQGTSRSGPGSRFCGSFLHGLLFKVLCEKKASEMNMLFKLKKFKKYVMTSFKPIKSRDCVDYIEIQYHSTSQYKGLYESCESECHKTFNLRPAPGGQACCDPGWVSLAKKCLLKRWWSCLQNNESKLILQYVHVRTFISVYAKYQNVWK